VIADPLLMWLGGEEFVDARDCALANVAALDAAAPAQGVYNIGDGAMTGVDNIVAAVHALHPGLEVNLRVTPRGGFAGFPHPRPAPSDLSAAARELHWAPRHGVAAAVAHYAPWIGASEPTHRSADPSSTLA
jgi:UDP-glucose 4-epimerase